MSRLGLCLAVLLCGAPVLALAQTVAQTELVLPPMVVSPTRIPTPPAEIGSDVTVITADDIERNQWRTLPDALRAVPGIFVSQNGGPGSDAAVFRELHQLYECIRQTIPEMGAEFDTLSAGMSDDFPLAIAEGATMVRVGSAIFGSRTNT